MSFRFHRSIPNISIFHNPTSPASQRALKLLRSALSHPYPPESANSGPLTFNLDVVENTPPTTSQLSTILSYLSQPVSSLVSAHPSVSAEPHDVKTLHEMASRNINALKFPLVVNWDDGQVAVGEADGVSRILEELRKKRDGEASDDDHIHHPKGWLS